MAFEFFFRCAQGKVTKILLSLAGAQEPDLQGAGDTPPRIQFIPAAAPRKAQNILLSPGS